MVGFVIFVILIVLGLIFGAIDIAKGKKGSDISSLPEPIRKALGSWF